MKTPDLLNIRLYNQLLSGHELKQPREVVSRMGAMQSQSLDLAKWAIGTRLESKTVADVEKALNTGKIIRTHILRPTWHFVAADDIHWMRELSNPQIKPIYLSYCRMCGADEAVIARAVPIVEKSLSNGGHLEKQEIGEALKARRIKADATLLNLIIQRAEMEGILCNGKIQGNKQTYALLNEWVPRKRNQTISREAALERLARRYFTSHGPATLLDFEWWSGLSLTDSRRAVEMIKNDFVCEKASGREFWMRNDIKTPPKGSASALLLPPFDEFVVSYKDRSEMIHDAHYGKVMTRNGLFSPTVMLNGEIVGSWKKTSRKGAVRIELSFFEKTSKRKQQLFEPEIRRLEKFYSDRDE
ncbi:hypothetical protein M2447_001974 [Ereboglobus sp. PH5-10]|uniref:winged helix DNA-binding domain-containing protein n=1 Tax=Ereboglobus sp. PH5-10 TaxID=2940629 RepID=UPI002406ECDE|nr:winged helix DNA-binding domain-containing protein [Ereboglobus sp. PH5-10]MDF9827869.1 hypothetical protein [Ereboglobus sp. PH5-10]